MTDFPTQDQQGPWGTQLVAAITERIAVPQGAADAAQADATQALSDAAEKVPSSGGQMTGPLELVSTDEGGLDTSDSTNRIILNSYQAGGNNFGEVMRIRLRPQTGDVVGNRAKGMIAWQMPEDLDVDDDFHSVTWIGAHWGAQDADDAGDIHAHWSIETPDAIGHLQTRFAISLADESGTFGANKTLITTSSADLVVGCDSGQVLRLKSGPATSAQVEAAKTVWGGTNSARWRFGMNGDTESGAGAGAGSNFVIDRYGDNGSRVDSPLKVTRSNGRVTIGGDAGTSAGLTVTRAGSGTAMVIDTYLSGVGATGVTGYQHLSADATSIALSTRVTTDTIDRIRIYADGKIEIGPGNAGRDTNLYRSAADVLKTDDSFHVGATFRHLGSSLGVFNTAATTKQTVTGSRGANAALASLLTALAAYGLITNSTDA